MPTQRLTAALLLLLFALAGCSTVAEIAYDNKVGRDKDACGQLLDNSSYRSCMDRVRAVEQEAKRARKDN